ncbi:MAG: hypothetical protein HC910_14345 [Spirulinaceae cyanobacterium SM2_1_0]|nr:hypothetical protein [Spirulinaceae cyanobacterium SM2_1_0]
MSALITQNSELKIPRSGTRSLSKSRAWMGGSAWRGLTAASTRVADEFQGTPVGADGTEENSDDPTESTSWAS